MPPESPSPTDPTAGHSPLPWWHDGRHDAQVDARRRGYIRLAPSGIDCRPAVCRVSETGIGTTTARANAALIVRAVNAMPAYRACVAALRVYLDRAADAVDQWEVSDEVRAMLLGEEYDAARDALAALPTEGA